MQARAKPKDVWIVDEQSSFSHSTEPLMGWKRTSQIDGKFQRKFKTLDEAIGYCKRYDFRYRVLSSPDETKNIRSYGYAENFLPRREPWSH